MTADLSTQSAADRLVAALAIPGATFTGEQLVWFIAQDRRWMRGSDPDPLSYAAGYQAGYRARLAEENEEYRQATEAHRTHGGEAIRWMDKVDARRRADADARRRRLGDHAGGPVETWE